MPKDSEIVPVIGRFIDDEFFESPEFESKKQQMIETISNPKNADRSTSDWEYIFNIYIKKIKDEYLDDFHCLTIEQIYYLIIRAIKNADIVYADLHIPKEQVLEEIQDSIEFIGVMLRSVRLACRYCMNLRCTERDDEDPEADEDKLKARLMKFYGEESKVH